MILYQITPSLVLKTRARLTRTGYTKGDNSILIYKRFMHLSKGKPMLSIKLIHIKLTYIDK